MLDGIPNNMHHGVPLSYEGARIHCPACNSEGYAQKVPPFWPMSMMGKAAILDGDLCICKCNPPPTLIASQTDRSMSFESQPASVGDAAYRSAASSNAIRHDQHFRIINSDGNPVSGLPFRIEVSGGETVTGTTSADGLTKLVSSNSAKKVQLRFHIDGSR